MEIKVDEKEGEHASGSQSNKEIEMELEPIPNFEEMTQEEMELTIGSTIRRATILSTENLKIQTTSL